MSPGEPTLDLRTQAGELARRLGNLKTFLAAAQVLLESVRRLRHEVLRMQNKKIITLIEISRATLTRAAIPLYLFTSCAPALRPYKSAYFDLLRALKDRRDIVDDPQLQARASRLLMPLRPTMFIPRNSDVSACAFDSTIARPLCHLHTSVTRSRRRCSVSPQRPSSTTNTSMPPPSIPLPCLPSPTQVSARGRPKNRVVEVQAYARTRSPPRHCMSSPANDEECWGDQQENVPTLPLAITIPQSPRRKFGIFCTGVNVGYRQREREWSRRNGGARLVRKA